MIKEIEVKVTGRVQLVMFRDFTTRKARRLGLVGMVQNMDDGSVRIVAQGEEGALKYILVNYKEDILKYFLKIIHRCPILSRVDTVEVLWREPVEHFTKFAIIYS